MKVIILFLLSIPFYECFHFVHISIPIPKKTKSYYCIDPNSKIQDNEEKKNSRDETQNPVNRILNTDPNKKRLSYKHHYKGSGIDERYSNSNILEDTEYLRQMEKLAKFSYQMKLLKKIESNKISEPCKLEAINEYNYLFEKRKYITNIESGGLYDSWDDPGF